MCWWGFGLGWLVAARGPIRAIHLDDTLIPTHRRGLVAQIRIPCYFDGTVCPA